MILIKRNISNNISNILNQLVFFIVLLILFPAEARADNALIYGALLDLDYSQASLISLAQNPSLGIRLPFPLTTTMSLSNSKFKLKDPLSVLYLKGNLSSWLASLLNNSFDLEGLTPKDVSKTLSKELKGGVDIDIEFTADYIKIAKNLNKKNQNCGIVFGIQSKSIANIHLPGDAFALFFSYEDGLQKGNAIDFKSLYGEFVASTDFYLGFGKKLKKISNMSKRGTEFLWGISAVYKLGHYMLETEMDDGLIVYNNDNVMDIYSNMKIKTAGINLRNDLSASINNIINGHGFGISTDFSIITKRLALSLGIKDIGAIFWNSNLNQINVSFSKDSVTIISLIEDDIEKALTISNDEKEILTQPLRAEINFNFTLYSDKKKKNAKLNLCKISNARAFAFTYKQPLIGGVALDYNPMFLMAFENEFFNGVLPVKIEWAVKTDKQYSSFIQLRQVVTKGLSFSLGYEAINDGLFRWNKGCKVSLSSNIYFD